MPSMPSMRALSSVAAALAALSLSAAAVLVPAQAAAAAATAAAAPVVTPTQAAAIFAAYAAANNKANATFDIPLQDKHEQGAARALDDAVFRIAARVGLAGFPPAANEDVHVFVPRQAHYPAVFVATSHPKVGGAATSRFTSVYVFERTSASATWKLADGTSLPVGSTVKFAVGKDGYIPTLDPSTLLVTPAKLYPAWIAAQTLMGRGAKPSSAWAVNSLVREAVLVAPDAVANVRLTASSAHYAPLCVASVTGAFCVVSTTLTSRLDLTPGEIAAGDRYQITDPGDRVDFGGLADGTYTSVKLTGQRSSAITVPLAHGKGGLQLVGIEYSATAGVGTPG